MRNKKRQSAPPSVNIHIDELVLHGFAPNDHQRIADAVQAELTRLFAEQGVSTTLRQGGEANRLQGAAINITPAMRGEEIGTEVARSVYGSLNPTMNREYARNAKL